VDELANSELSNLSAELSDDGNIYIRNIPIEKEYTAYLTESELPKEVSLLYYYLLYLIIY
jgi:hypothetical protein